METAFAFGEPVSVGRKTLRLNATAGDSNAYFGIKTINYSSSGKSLPHPCKADETSIDMEIDTIPSTEGNFCLDCHLPRLPYIVDIHLDASRYPKIF